MYTNWDIVLPAGWPCLLEEEQVGKEIALIFKKMLWSWWEPVWLKLAQPSQCQSWAGVSGAGGAGLFGSWGWGCAGECWVLLADYCCISWAV